MWGGGGGAQSGANGICDGERCIFRWCVINPLDPRTYEQAASLLGTERCAGLKFHPEEHCYEIKQVRARRAALLFPCASAVTLPKD